MADGVTVAQRGQHLMDRAHAHGRTAPAGMVASTSSAGWQRAASAREEPWQGFDHRLAVARLTGEPIERLEVLPLDDRPGVVRAEVRAAVAAQRVAEARARRDGVQRLGKLRVALVEQTRIAAKALAFEHVASAVGQHRLAERPRFQRHHRQALVVGRHDQHLGGCHGVELVLIGQETEVADARVVGYGQDRIADEHQREPTRHGALEALEELEELLAALVLVDASHVDRKRARHAVLLAKAIGLRVVRARRSRCRPRRRKGRVQRRVAALPALRVS